jgi:hypothetical protein
MKMQTRQDPNVHSRIQMPNSKVPDSHRNMIRELLELMKECTSIEGMYKAMMQSSEKLTVASRARMSLLKDESTN